MAARLYPHRHGSACGSDFGECRGQISVRQARAAAGSAGLVSRTGLSVAQRTMPADCGTMLVDTGVAAMYMTVSPAQAGGQTDSLLPGTHVSIRVGTPDESSEL